MVIRILCFIYKRTISRIVRWGQIYITNASQNMSVGWLMSPSSLKWRSRSILQDFICLFYSEVGCSLVCTPRRGDYVAVISAFSYKEVCPIGWVLQPTPSFMSFLTSDVQKADEVFGVTFIPIYFVVISSFDIWPAGVVFG